MNSNNQSSQDALDEEVEDVDISQEGESPILFFTQSSISDIDLNTSFNSSHYSRYPLVQLDLQVNESGMKYGRIEIPSEQTILSYHPITTNELIQSLKRLYHI